MTDNLGKRGLWKGSFFRGRERELRWDTSTPGRCYLMGKNLTPYRSQITSRTFGLKPSFLYPLHASIKHLRMNHHPYIDPTLVSLIFVCVGACSQYQRPYQLQQLNECFAATLLPRSYTHQPPSFSSPDPQSSTRPCSAFTKTESSQAA